ncbi:DUF58 domain-containing protein [Pontibacter sp. G13]|uniref:DUF58 domain-containing protein n=1 Tax=Pontibacter sp. G13 TaxID=3074898 RepID=UPI00288C3D8F|nr:DUF58 domain-containing protein [Pontibacter sp. G13]WNJ17368.1 DUF58 domain-containing protein [Pontibacter sp. G13]
MARTEIKYLDPVVVRKLKNIEIKAKLIVEGFITGMHRSPYHGFSVEFAEHRPYNVGESLKSIDWKVYAKTDKLFSKRFEEETNLRCQVVLDISDSMRYPQQGMTKLEYGAYLAAALQYLMIGQRDAAGMTLFDEEIQFYAPAKSKYSWLVPIFKKLESVVATTELFTHKTATAKVLHQVAMKFHRRSFVVLITDLFNQQENMDDLVKAIQHLRHEKHEVLVFHLLDKETEENFEFPNRPVILQDLETGEKLEVQPNQIRSEYTRMMQAYKAQLKQRCMEYRIDFVEVDIRQPYDKVLADYLVKRRTLK